MVLVLAPAVPDFDRYAGSLRLYRMLSILARHFSVVFVPTDAPAAPGRDTGRYVEGLRRLGSAPRIFAPGELWLNFLATGYQTTPCPSSALVRREVLLPAERFAAPAHGSPCEDQYLWWTVALHWAVAVHTEVLVRYRQHPHSALARASAAPDATRNAERIFLHAMQLELKNIRPDDPLVRRRTLAQRAARLDSVPDTSRSPWLRSARRLAGRLVSRLRGLGRHVRTRILRPARRWLRERVGPLLHLRARAWLALGVRPLSEVWGADRGHAICRYYLEQFLQEFAADIRGRCLEFQEDAYTTRFGGRAVTAIEILHVDDSNPRATIVADLTKPNDLPTGRFDCVICTHVLHVIFDLQRAVAELHRILAPGGVLLVGVPHVSMCDPGWHELWRFTPEGLHALLATAFGPENVLVRAYGNSLTAAGQLRGLVVHEFSRRELETHDPRFAVEVCARARKPGGAGVGVR